MSLPAASLSLRHPWFRLTGFGFAAAVALSIVTFAPRAVGQTAGQGAVQTSGQTSAQVSVAEPPTWSVCAAAASDVADAELATFCAGVRAERSMHALSRRYSELWARLAGEQRSEFSVTERRWLSAGRYAERDACVAHHTKSGVVPAGLQANLLAAECLAQVTAQRLAAVELRYAAMQ